MSNVSTLQILQETSPELGVLTHLDYTTATVATNDYLIKEVGGVPKYAFLLALPENADEIILLKVEGVADMESQRDLKALRESLAQNSPGPKGLDTATRARLQAMGFACSVVGSFYEVGGSLRFGTDLEELFAYTSYKVLKPQGKSLSAIASFTRPHPQGVNERPLNLGIVRYTDTQRSVDSEAIVFADVRDFIGKKTFFCGATRTGKSNSVKVITQQVYRHSKQTKTPIGQLLFDPQGEYANENVQDGGALASMGNGRDVVIYRAKLKHDNTYEKPLKLNFLEEANAALLWDLMLLELSNGISGNANYISGLSSISFDPPSRKLATEAGANYNQLRMHYDRKRLGLYAFLKLCHIDGPVSNLTISVGKENVPAAVALVEDNSIQGTSQAGEVRVSSTAAAKELFEWLTVQGLGEVQTGQDGTLLPRSLQKIKKKVPTTGPLEDAVQYTLSESWVKDLAEGDMAEFVKQFDAFYSGRTGLVAAFSRLKPLHSDKSQGDMREEIWEDLRKGRVIIVDLSQGSSRTSVVLSELIVNSIMEHASARFTSGQEPVRIQVVVEEAHNLFSRNGAQDETNDPWVRLSKEAAKYEIGLLYATQEVTSVDPRILSNTSNWIVAHLNSRVETNELAKYYSFEEWGSQIRKAESKGFVRLKTESSPFIIPMQIHKFVPTKDI